MSYNRGVTGDASDNTVYYRPPEKKPVDPKVAQQQTMAQEAMQKGKQLHEAKERKGSAIGAKGVKPLQTGKENAKPGHPIPPQGSHKTIASKVQDVLTPSPREAQGEKPPRPEPPPRENKPTRPIPPPAANKPTRPIPPPAANKPTNRLQASPQEQAPATPRPLPKIPGVAPRHNPEEALKLAEDWGYGKPPEPISKPKPTRPPPPPPVNEQANKEEASVSPRYEPPDRPSPKPAPRAKPVGRPFPDEPLEPLSPQLARTSSTPAFSDAQATPIQRDAHSDSEITGRERSETPPPIQFNRREKAEETPSDKPPPVQKRKSMKDFANRLTQKFRKKGSNEAIQTTEVKAPEKVDTKFTNLKVYAVLANLLTQDLEERAKEGKFITEEGILRIAPRPSKADELRSVFNLDNPTEVPDELKESLFANNPVEYGGALKQVITKSMPPSVQKEIYDSICIPGMTEALNADRAVKRELEVLLRTYESKPEGIADKIDATKKQIEELEKLEEQNIQEAINVIYENIKNLPPEKKELIDSILTMELTVLELNWKKMDPKGKTPEEFNALQMNSLLTASKSIFDTLIFSSEVDSFDMNVRGDAIALQQKIMAGVLKKFAEDHPVVA